MFARVATVVLLSSLAGTGQVQTYKDPTATPEARAVDLAGRMTLEEKVRQMQNVAPAIPRLGVPAYDWWNEGLHGVARAGLATVFPQAIGLAATWDTVLEQRIADVISTEARAKYNDAILHGNHGRYFGLTFWSPNINIFRDPRWGRGQETFGEDPWLTSRMAIAFIKGMQGNDSRYFKTIATAKHFAVHSGPEKSRHSFNVKPSDEDLAETYLPAFKASVQEGGADSVMCAYNRVDGQPACASELLLPKTLRGDWQFKGYVVSDCGAVDDILEGHHYRPTMAEAAAAAVKSGTDLTCGTEYATLVEAVKRGLIQEQEVNRSLERLLTARFRLGMFDPPEQVPWSGLSMKDVDTASNRNVALEAAEKSIVLLKNESKLLPLKKETKIAVIGPTANDPAALLGNYNGTPSYIITPFDGISRAFGKDNVLFAQGATYTEISYALVPPAALPGGLTAEYFTDSTLKGQPFLKRTEPQGYFVWDMRDPALAGVTQKNAFAVRWTGALTAAEAGIYQLGVVRLPCPDCTGSDSARVYLDDKLVVDHTGKTNYDTLPKTAPVQLRTGKTYKLRIEYRQRGGGAGLELVWQPPADAALREAVSTAQKADVVVLCVGLNSSLEGEEMKVAIPGFAGGDRTTLDLPAHQAKLLDSMLGTGKPVIMVLVNGSALGLKTAKEHASAIIETWYGGQDAGTALARTLSGETNPAGRLPVTFYESIDQLPAFENYSMKGRTYRYFAGVPLYPFGYGLSYSTFKYSDLQVTAASGTYTVTANVTNASERDGDEVAQVYVTRENAGSSWRSSLRAFERVHLVAHEVRTLRFTVDEKQIPQAAHLSISVGSGQPIDKWTAGQFVQTKIGQ